jgi:hypothetical protein
LEVILEAIGSDEEVPAERQDLPNPFERLSRNQALVSYCLELDAIHEDLDFLLYEMDMAVRFLHAELLDDKRMALVYHSDNFYLRIHAYWEKVFALVNHCLELGFLDADHNLRGKVFAALSQPRLRQVSEILNGLQRDPMISKAIRRRHRLVHAIAEREWTVISPEQRADEHFRGRRAVDEIERMGNVEELHRGRQEEFGRMCGRLARFRDDLVKALQAAIA